MNRENERPLPQKQAYLEQLHLVLALSLPWEEWLAETGEPWLDFQAKPSCPDLPAVIEACLNWCDGCFGREGRRFPTPLIYLHDWGGRREANGETSLDAPASASSDLLMLDSGVPVATVAH